MNVKKTFPGPLYLLAVWSLAFGLFVQFFPPSDSGAADQEAARAVSLMSRAIGILREHRESYGPPIDPRFDLNRTGLIGVETSPITTSPGHLEAKRTATNPRLAGAVVRMFREAGAGRGDRVAIGASGSFPGMILAALCAAEALGLQPVVVSSLGASNWGGNHPAWTWLEMSECLRGKGVLDVSPVAYSLGGENDKGDDMSAEGRLFLAKKIRESGRPFIDEPVLMKNVAARVRLFEESAGGGSIKVFVNVGGSYADMGTDGEILKLRPGFNPAAEVFVPPAERRGMIQEMARRGIPVIHLLYVKGLCDRYGLPWDPVPLPGPETTRSGRGPSRSTRPIILVVYLAGMIIGLFGIARKNSRLGI